MGGGGLAWLVFKLRVLLNQPILGGLISVKYRERAMTIGLPGCRSHGAKLFLWRAS